MAADILKMLLAIAADKMYGTNSLVSKRPPTKSPIESFQSLNS
jgi:hypothetical protein